MNNMDDLRRKEYLSYRHENADYKYEQYVIYQNFMSDNIVFDNNFSCSLHEAHVRFKEWYRENYPFQSFREGMISKQTFKENLMPKLGKIINGRWQGIKLKPLED